MRSSCSDQAERIIIGAMTGTSCDGLDVAALRVRGRGLEAEVELIATESIPLEQLGDRLRRVADQVPVSVGTIAELSQELSQLHARTIAKLGTAAARSGGRPWSNNLSSATIDLAVHRAGDYCSAIKLCGVE